MNRKTQILFILAFILITLFVINRNYNIYLDKEKQQHSKMISELNLAYNFILKEQVTSSKIFFKKVINQPDVLAILQDANSNDKKNRNIARKQLYNKFIKDYERIKLFGAGQFHFHLANSESFLRFNRPKKYGDSLKGIRFSVDKANAELVDVHGFEEGRIFNGFRNVYPIIDKGKHLGSVEISTSFQYISERIEEMLQDKSVFIFRKEVVNKKTFYTEKNNYKSCNLSNDYLVESGFHADSLMIGLNQNIKSKIASKLGAGKSFIVSGRYKNKIYDIIFFPVYNVENQQIAYLISYKEDIFHHTYFSEFVKYSIIMVLVLIIFFFLLHQLFVKNSRLHSEISNRKKIEQALKESEERLRTLINSTPDIICFKDGEGRWIEANKADLELFSLCNVDYRGKTDLELAEFTDPIYKESFLTCEASDEKTWQTKKVQRGDETIVKPDGTQNTYDVIKVPLFEDDGSRKGLVVLGREINARKKIEQALKESEAKFNAIFNNNPNPTHLINTNFEIILTNKELLELKGLKQEDIFGKKCYEVYQNKKGICKNCAVRKLFQTKKECRYENQLTLPDGTIKYFETYAYPIYDEHGKISYAVETTIDITDRKKAEQALKESEAKFREIINQINDGIVVCDEEKKIVIFNKGAEQIFDLKAKDVINIDLADFQYKFSLSQFKNNEKINQTLNSVVTQEKTEIFNKIIDNDIVVNNEIKNLQSVIFQIKFENHNLFCSVIRDITGIKQYEKQLKKYAKTQEVLFQEVNHRVKNNLSAIIGLIEKEQDNAVAKNFSHPQIFVDLIDRIEGLASVHSLLSQSNWQPLPITNLCDQIIIGRLNDLPLNRKIEIDIDRSSQVLINSSQAHQLALVINELATNTIKHARLEDKDKIEDKDKENIKIKVKIEQKDNEITLIFSDNGPGFPQEILEGNFENAGIGIELIIGITSHTLGGNVKLENDNGAKTIITFENELSNIDWRENE